MNKIFITGATGYLGARLALKLANEGHQVHALCRSIKKTEGLQHANITFFEGNLADIASLEKAMAGCNQVYHMAALATVWDADPQNFYKINVQGTINILNLAVKLSIEKIVITSTAGVMGHSSHHELVNETASSNIVLETEYERTKLAAENQVMAYVKNGLNAVIVNPTRIYGPGLMSESNAGTRLIQQFAAGKWRIIPGNGTSVGNYVYVDDVVQGHILAMQKGKAGERYILGGENASFNEYFQLLRKLTASKHTMVKVPIFFMLLFAYIQLLLAKLFKKKPLITPPFVRKYAKNWYISSEKAQKELGYTITPLEEGFKKTLAWLVKPSKNQLI